MGEQCALDCCAMPAARICLLVASLVCSLSAQVPQFEAVAQPHVGSASLSIASAGDFDGDGDQDLVVFEAFVGVQVMENDGRANFSSLLLPYVSPVFGFGVLPVFIDFDGDTDLDVFVSAPSVSGLFRNDGGGVWTDVSAALPSLPSASRIYVGDFDGDGDDDMACAGLALAGSHNQMLVNTGGGTFTSIVPFPGFFGQSIDAADIDGDGDLDLVLPEVAPVIWRNDGGMVFTDITTASLPALPGTPAVCAFGDVNGDGHPDLLVGMAQGGGDRVLINGGAGVFVELSGAAPQGLGGTQSVVLRDVDLDGDVDLLRGTVFHPPTLARNDGTGVFQNELNAYATATPAMRFLLVEDFDGDLDVDVFAYEVSSLPQVLLNNHRQLRSNGAPQIGQPWTIDVVSQPGYASGPRAVQLGVALHHLAQPLRLVPAGALWLDPTQPLLTVPALLAGGVSTASVSLLVPPIPALVGLHVHAQAVVQEFAGPTGLRLTPLHSWAVQ